MKMPVIFAGHGSPMNAIETNAFTETWKRIGEKLPKPKAILAVSAHWYTEDTRTSDTVEPRMIYDMYGFPPELYALKYPAAGSPELAQRLISILGDSVRVDNAWGIDHGTWSVLCRMFPDADIPVVQLSIDYKASPERHYRIGEALKDLREEGVLILGSGNVVHNLALINWQMEGGYPWAQEFDDYIKANVIARSFENVIHFERAGDCHKKAFYTLEHYLPLLYVLGCTDPDDALEVFNDACMMGSMSMTGYLFTSP